MSAVLIFAEHFNQLRLRFVVAGADVLGCVKLSVNVEENRLLKPAPHAAVLEIHVAGVYVGGIVIDRTDARFHRSNIVGQRAAQGGFTARHCQAHVGGLAHSQDIGHVDVKGNALRHNLPGLQRQPLGFSGQLVVHVQRTRLPGGIRAVVFVEHGFQHRRGRGSRGDGGRSHAVDYADAVRCSATAASAAALDGQLLLDFAVQVVERHGAAGFHPVHIADSGGLNVLQGFIVRQIGLKLLQNLIRLFLGVIFAQVDGDGRVFARQRFAVARQLQQPGFGVKAEAVGFGSVAGHQLADSLVDQLHVGIAVHAVHQRAPFQKLHAHFLSAGQKQLNIRSQICHYYPPVQIKRRAVPTPPVPLSLVCRCRDFN